MKFLTTEIIGNKLVRDNNVLTARLREEQDDIGHIQLQGLIYSFLIWQRILCHSSAVSVFAPIRLHLGLFVIYFSFQIVQHYISAMPFPQDGDSPHKTSIR